MAVARVLAELHGVDAVQAAAKILHNQGVVPVPGRVAQELQRRASAAAAASAAARAEARAAELEAASRRRGDRDMAELLARRVNETSQERNP